MSRGINYYAKDIKNILDSLSKSTCSQETVLKNILAILTASIQETGVTNIVSGVSGSISPGMKSVSIHNTGDTDILIQGEIVPPGEIVEFSATMNNVLDEITYNSQLSTILITTLQ